MGMIDKEKAIRILEGNYKNSVLRHNGELLTVNELIELLKAQDPKRVSIVNNGFTGLPVTHCPKCHRPIDMFYGAHGAETEFCPWCGQAVKWE